MLLQDRWRWSRGRARHRRRHRRGVLSRGAKSPSLAQRQGAAEPWRWSQPGRPPHRAFRCDVTNRDEIEVMIGNVIEVWIASTSWSTNAGVSGPTPVVAGPEGDDVREALARHPRDQPHRALPLVWRGGAAHAGGGRGRILNLPRYAARRRAGMAPTVPASTRDWPDPLARPDVARRQRQRCRAGQANHAVLAGTVGGHPRSPVLPRIEERLRIRPRRPPACAAPPRAHSGRAR